MAKVLLAFLLPITATLTDAQGAAVPLADVDGAPSWSVDRADLAVLHVEADGGSAVLEPLGVGTVNVTVSADALLGDGVETITQTFEVEIVDEASHITLTAGTPVPKPTPASGAQDGGAAANDPNPPQAAA